MPIVAISSNDFQELGCPYCGGKDGQTMLADKNQALWCCATTACKHSCVVLGRGVTVGYVGEDRHEVKLQPHPRRIVQGAAVAAEEFVGPPQETFSGSDPPEASPQKFALSAREIFTLWQTEDASNAYIDQFGIPHRGFVVLKQVPVITVQKRTVPSLGDGTQHEALRAISIQTREVFTRDWAGFIEDSMAPGFYWDYRKDERGIWRPVDGCKAYNLKLFVPYVTPDGQRAVPLGADICRIHDYASLGGQRCIGCYVEEYRARRTS